MSYGIKPLSEYNQTYVWRHNSQGEALTVAERIATEANIEVLVFKIIGIYKPIVIFEEEKD